MKSRWTVLLLLSMLTLALILPPHAAARPLSQSITFQVQVGGPDAQGVYTADGTFTASGLDPTGPNNSYYVNIYVEFIGSGGAWPVFYDGQDLSKGCFTLGGNCLSKAQVDGNTLGSVRIHSYQLSHTENGTALHFGGNFRQQVPQ